MARTKYKPRTFESTGKRNDTSANIYESMLQSPAYQDLTKNQKLLYVYAKSQYYGKRKPGKDYPEITELQGDDLFYFNLSVAVKYGLYKKSGRKEFYRDIKNLITHGFIECISNGKSTHSKSIYKYSDGWRYWTDK